MSLRPDDPQAALAGLAASYGCTVPPGGQWFLHDPDGELIARSEAAGAGASASGLSTASASSGDDETLNDAQLLLDTLANAPADIAIVYGTDGHSRAVRIGLEIADALARPLTLAGASHLLSAARILMNGEQGARSGEILQHLRSAREASQAAANAVQSWQEDSDDSDWPSSAYVLVPEPELARDISERQNAAGIRNHARHGQASDCRRQGCPQPGTTRG